MCLFERFGNCDKETANNEYCLFHKPNKSAAEAKAFYERLEEKFVLAENWEYIKGRSVKKRVFASNLDFRGFYFPKVPSDLDFSFSNAVFSGFVMFDYAVFEDGADFWNSIFLGPASFIGTKFAKHASFFEAIFTKDADFSNAVFEGKADFWEAVFKEDATFWEARFNDDALFVETTFFGKANFGLAIFTYASFMAEERSYWFTFETASAEKHRIIRYLFAEHNFDIVSSNIKIEQNRILVDDRIKSAEIVVRGSDAKLTISDPIIKKTYKLEVEYSEGKHRIFVKGTYRFWNELNFSGISFNTIEVDLPGKSFRLPFAEAEACRVQRISYEKQGKRFALDRIFVRERRALRRSRVWNSWYQFRTSTGLRKLYALFRMFLAYVASFFEFLLADLTCEYGTNWLRAVLLWIFVVLLLFPAAYYLTGSIDANNPLDYIYFSAITATTVGYGDIAPQGIAKLLAMAEAVFGLFIWAVFLAVFSRRFMA